MYKSFIIDKIESVKTSRELGERPQPKCKHCNEIGHYSKKYYMCRLFKRETADDVGTSGKRQSSSIKSEKREAKRRRVEGDPNATCKSCKSVGHNTSRSPLCPNHISSKLEVMNANLGRDFKAFTRKLPLDTCIKERHKEVIKNKIISASDNVRQIIFRAKLFVNYYITCHSTEVIDDRIFKQPFWYSICQLVNNKRVTNGNGVSPGLINDWNTFKGQHPSIVYAVELDSGVSQCLTEACIEVSVSYLNAVVETYEKRVMFYLYYLIQNTCLLLEPKDVKLIVKDYCYQYVCRGKPEWPASLNLSEELKLKIRSACEPLRKLTEDPITLKNLSASPGKYIRCFSHILSFYEKEHRTYCPYDVRRIPLPKLFSLFPLPSFRWRYVSISVNALSGFLNRSVPRGYQNQLDLFQEVFDFDKLKNTVETPEGENSILFNNYVRSDGFAIDFVFNKRNQPNHSIDNHDLNIQDFEYDEVVTSYRPTFIDPGRKSAFTAVVGLEDEHQVRKCSTSEYYHLTGSTVYQKKLQEKKDETGITAIESNTPSANTTLKTVYDNYATHVLNNKDILFEFYGFQTAKDHFYLYQGRQKAPQIMVNMLVNGSKKYDRKQRKKKKKKRRPDNQRNSNTSKALAKRKWRPAKFYQDKAKVPLIVFGNGMFNKDSVKFKGIRTGVTGVLWSALQRRQKEGDLLVIEIDEFKTSRICSRCYGDSLQKVKDIKGHSVLGCVNCKTLWQRDINAANNMSHIASSIWKGHNRPPMFQRATTTTSTT